MLTRLLDKLRAPKENPLVIKSRKLAHKIHPAVLHTFQAFDFTAKDLTREEQLKLAGFIYGMCVAACSSTNNKDMSVLLGVAIFVVRRTIEEPYKQAFFDILSPEIMEIDPVFLAAGELGHIEGWHVVKGSKIPLLFMEFIATNYQKHCANQEFLTLYSMMPEADRQYQN